MDVTALPFNQLIGLRRSERPDLGILSLDGAPRYHNHLGTVHAAAQFALAEACSGEYLLTRYPELAEGHVGVVRRVEVKYRNPAQGEIYARARASDEAMRDLEGKVGVRGRAFVTIEVDVVDADGVTAMEAAFEWFIQRLA